VTERNIFEADSLGFPTSETLSRRHGSEKIKQLPTTESST